MVLRQLSTLIFLFSVSLGWDPAWDDDDDLVTRLMADQMFVQKTIKHYSEVTGIYDVVDKAVRGIAEDYNIFVQHESINFGLQKELLEYWSLNQDFQKMAMWGELKEFTAIPRLVKELEKAKEKELEKLHQAYRDAWKLGPKEMFVNYMIYFKPMSKILRTNLDENGELHLTEERKQAIAKREDQLKRLWGIGDRFTELYIGPYTDVTGVRDLANEAVNGFFIDYDIEIEDDDDMFRLRKELVRYYNLGKEDQMKLLSGGTLDGFPTMPRLVKALEKAKEKELKKMSPEFRAAWKMGPKEMFINYMTYIKPIAKIIRANLGEDGKLKMTKKRKEAIEKKEDHLKRLWDGDVSAKIEGIIMNAEKTFGIDGDAFRRGEIDILGKRIEKL